MPKFRFEDSGTFYATLEVEAETREEAQEVAWDMHYDEWDFFDTDVIDAECWEVY